MSNLIKLYAAATPNGRKIPLLLELLKLKYEIVKVSFQDGDHKKPEYLAMNPNGKIPILVDPSTNTTITETAAILTYLADTYDKERKFSYEYKSPEYYKQLEMMYFQMSAIGPMITETFYYSFASEKSEVAVNRCATENKRAMGVLNEHLKRNGSGFLAGKHLSLADLCAITFAVPMPLWGLQYQDFPEVQKWVKRMIDIPEINSGFRKLGEPSFWPTDDMF